MDVGTPGVEGGGVTSVPTIAIPCPDCGSVLVIRAVKQTGVRFLACPRYPECTHTQDLPAWFHMVEAGADLLPGMEGV